MRKLSTIFFLLLTFTLARNAAANVCNVWWDFPPDYGVSLGHSFTLPECQDAFNHWWVDRCADTVNSRTDTTIEYWDGNRNHAEQFSDQCIVCTDGYPDGLCDGQPVSSPLATPLATTPTELNLMTRSR